ncbi:hypothetical protein SAMN04489724_0260 [Algoriphagus locisalis]|uniref:Uncharacterized protein n=1 Tax=Algoriphagus locisalis TaxID=305507 RepID=A0A1I7E878_9BACT|nr:hypothetical protein [Algoriphagus locisalis]SFU20176.1 hypothetical protein SAMN04489724_0260 [Algoriphagus locisalis]
MKKIFLSYLTVVCLLLSCTDQPEDPVISPSQDQIEVEAEGGVQQVEFTSQDWHIDKIENVQGDTRIFGDIFNLQDEKTGENILLQLENEGRLEAIWPNKGFVVVRDTGNTLQIQLEENSSGEPFEFRIFLSSPKATKTIRVSQKVSQGYSFKQLRYYVGEGDADSLYWKKGSSIKMDLPYSQEIEFTPIGGIDPTSSYLFSSDTPDAFVWLKSDSIAVRLPAHIQDQEVLLGEEEGIYTEYTQSEISDWTALKEKITVPAGTSQFRSEYEMRRRILSYRLLLTNNRTGDEKAIEGKLIQIAPTGDYRIISE